MTPSADPVLPAGPEIRSRRELAALRLSAQLIIPPANQGDQPTRPLDVVRHLLGLQAQDLPGARWSIGLRLPGSTEAAVTSALTSGEIVRSWPMRGTLHLVDPADLGWMLDIAAKRQATTAAKRRSDLEITDAQLAAAGEIAVELLTGGTALRRDALLAAWESRGISTAGQRAYHLLWNLGHAKLLVFGPPDEKQPTFALFDEWITAPRQLAGDEALAEFATRYFRGHGPATVRDFAWWASITLGDARRGLALAGGLEQREFGGVAHYLAAGLEPATSAIVALPGFDEYLLGYQDRTGVLAAEFFPQIVPGGNGIFFPTVVVDGEVQGTWKRVDSAQKVVIDLSEFTSLTKKAHAGFARAITHYGAFLGKPATVRDPAD